MTPAVGNLIFEQPHDLVGWQVRVKLSRNAIKPGVNAFTGTRRRGQQVAEKLR
jgi:hypothetical protein